jgi:hypothetical protein
MDSPTEHFGPIQGRIVNAIAAARELEAATKAEFSPLPDKPQPDWEKMADLGPMAVRLAEAMHGDFLRSPEYNGHYTSPPAALVAFAEKVEELGLGG